RNQYVKTKRGERIHAIEKILLVDFAFGLKVRHVDFGDGNDLLRVHAGFFFQLFHAVFENLDVGERDGAKGSALDKNGPFVKIVRGRQGFAFGAKQNRATDILANELQTHKPVI